MSYKFQWNTLSVHFDVHTDYVPAMTYSKGLNETQAALISSLNFIQTVIFQIIDN